MSVVVLWLMLSWKLCCWQPSDCKQQREDKQSEFLQNFRSYLFMSQEKATSFFLSKCLSFSSLRVEFSEDSRKRLHVSLISHFLAVYSLSEMFLQYLRPQQHQNQRRMNLVWRKTNILGYCSHVQTRFLTHLCTLMIIIHSGVCFLRTEQTDNQDWPILIRFSSLLDSRQE
jgi:hypothetical protein